MADFRASSSQWSSETLYRDCRILVKFFEYCEEAVKVIRTKDEKAIINKICSQISWESLDTELNFLEREWISKNRTKFAYNQLSKLKCLEIVDMKEKVAVEIEEQRDPIVSDVEVILKAEPDTLIAKLKEFLGLYNKENEIQSACLPNSVIAAVQTMGCLPLSYTGLSLKELSKGKEAEKVSDYLLQAKWLINRIHSIHRIEIPKKELLEKIFSGEVEELLQLFQKVAPQCISEKKIQKESILNINRNFDSKLILERSKSLDFETQQMISSLHTWIESTSRTQITRKEFIQNITWSDLYSVHRRNVEDLLELVLLLVPTWIWEEVKNNKVIYRIDRDITLESVSWIETA
ncbi:uncharacterized protein LOC133716023 [Rosa rugosa]|uniref:uncharacterized protein LOC133716023 n=1 Tax=Rosa rugosa TaxID=74645 RepID=UPI002B40FC9C|nr:uncharacterized protein LOC133716023 [Rosa rugosa]XP_061998736.1 uncharacterized protein LOC133716023 [Rosa rugosa]XP_061998737.1 uncharacterized protein LOC133716023 [Rosa rugosa]XP_061998738.1 uncharacterized protein LOC133716023 [Rosa rugosa]XP_061998739.1 uncharacterized protein LOC133716023 [Rosa rugosa]